jgi:hypothetical protein
VLGRVAATLAVWAYAGVGCILFIAEAMVGPVLFSLDYAHGVHLGDLVALVAFPAWAFFVSRSFWRHDRQPATRR